jgi:predicted ATPase/DNA-binding SARP family transcriptional activator
MAQLTINLLGAPQISLDGRPLDLRVRKELALLAFLAVEQERPLRRDTLLALLWPDAPEEAARNNLRVVLAGLRRLLGDLADAVLLADRRQLQFLPAGAHALDVAAFRALLAAVQAHDHVAPGTCAPCLERMEQAAALYCGDFLAGFSLPDSAPFEEWAALQREQLHQQQQATLQTLAVAHEARGDHAGQVAYGRRLLALEPWREAAHDLVIRGLWLLGERGAALEQYEACRRVLADELGLEPSPELTALVERLRQPAPVAETPAAARPAAPSPAYNLPAALTDLVGREEELGRLAAILARPNCRLVTLIGPGGIGKTSLALELARLRRHAYHDGAVIIQLAPLHQPEVVATAMLQTLGAKAVGDETPEAALRTWVRERHLLLILDNCEHLLEIAPLVGELLAAAPGLTVLATSREPLGIYGEQRFPVAPLQLPPLDAARAEAAGALPPDLARYAAVALFVQHVQAVRPDFALTSENSAAVAELCTRLDGLPLAIELAASHGDRLTPRQMLAQLRRGQGSLMLLTGHGRHQSARPQTLRATIAWSYDLLNAEMQVLFARLAVFRGGCTAEAVVALGAEPASLDALIDKSLVAVVEGPGDERRFTMLETIREYAQEQLEARGEAAAVARRHAAWFLSIAEAAEPHLSGSRDERGWWARLRTEEDNLRAALQWALDTGKPESGLRLAGALWQFWDLNNNYAEGRAWLTALLGPDLSATASPAARAKALNGLAMLALRQANNAAAAAAADASLALYRTLDDPAGMARVLLTLGNVAALGTGEYDRALAHYGEALARYREAHHPAGIAVALFNLGLGAMSGGDYRQARDWLDEAYGHYAELGSARWMARIQPYLASALLMTGDHVRAAALLDQTLSSWEAGIEHDLTVATQMVIIAASLAHSCRQPRQAALLLGTLDPLDAAVGASSRRKAAKQRLYQAISAGVSAELGPAAFETARAAGAALTIEQALAGVREVVTFATLRPAAAASAGPEPVDTVPQRPDDAAHALHAPGGELPAAPNLPAVLTPLVGRERELAELSRLLLQPEVRILSLVSVGGMGKTRLAQELGRANLAAFGDRVVFVPLAPLADPAVIAPAILAALDERPGSADPLQVLLTRLRPHRLLLILDNFEHLLGGATLVSAIAEAAPQVTVLVTSRERLNLRDEHQYLLRGLAVADDDATAALRLFVKRAQRVLPGFAIEPANRAAVLRICRLVDGIPLGIELAATWIEALSPAEIAAEIAQNLDFLAAEWRDLPERQRSMRAVFDWSWQHLSEAERQVLARLAVFRGGFTRQAAQAVAKASLPVLTRLLHKALIQPCAANEAPGRYEQHELLRQYADEQLQRRPGEAAVTAARHVAFYLELAERGSAMASNDEHEAWLAQVARDHDNIRAALAYTLLAPAGSARGGSDGPERSEAAPRSTELGLRLAGAVWPFWQRHCYLNEGREWIERLLARAGEGAVAPVVRANALYGAGWLAHDQDDFPSADAFFSAGLALDQALGKTGRVAQVLAHRGIMARGQGQFAEAITLVEASLALARGAEDLAGMAYALFRLGVIVRECGQFVRAVAIYEECRTAYRTLGDRRGEAFCLLGFADIARDQGDAATVHAYSTEALVLGRAIRQPWVAGFALNNLALAALMEGDLERATALGEEALTLFQIHDIRGGVVEMLVTTGQIATATGATEQAWTRLAEGIRRGWPVGPHWLVATGVEELARQLGPLPDAVRLHGAAKAWRSVMGVPVPTYRRSTYEASVAAARVALGEAQFATLWAEGALWSPERAVAVALTLKPVLQ